jgi:hypothetical protein
MTPEQTAREQIDAQLGRCGWTVQTKDSSCAPPIFQKVSGILGGEKCSTLANESLPNKLLVREYLTVLPDEKVLAAELEKTRKQLGARK